MTVTVAKLRHCPKENIYPAIRHAPEQMVGAARFKSSGAHAGEDRMPRIAIIKPACSLKILVSRT